MEKIEIPFQSDFENVMLAGKKSATSRTKCYGYPGDWFEAFGRTFILTDVCRLPLDVIAYDHYLEEGFDRPEDFIKCWEKLHPRKGYKPEQKVYFHTFKLQSDMGIFHIHELTKDGVCRICGCDPRPIFTLGERA